MNIFVNESVQAFVVSVQQKSFRVHTTLLASVCHAMSFSAFALKKNIFLDVDIVV